MIALRIIILTFICFFGIHLHAESAIRVWVGIPPLGELVRSVGGSAVEVHLLTGSGQNHETFAPTVRQLQGLAHADVYFSSGLPFEHALLQRLNKTMPELRVVDTVGAIPLLGIMNEHSCVDCPADPSQHAHRVDIHRWMSPPILISQIKMIADTLSQLQPQASEQFQQQASALTVQLETLDRDLQQQFQGFQNHAFLINHPALGYFANRYGLRQIAVENEGVQPSPARIRELSQLARDQKLDWIIVQVGQPRTAAMVLAQTLQLPIIEVDPFNPDAISEMRALTQALTTTQTKRDY
jgi:zinc transport system substrate-binding protein